MSAPRPILIVEDDAALRATLAEQIALEGEFTTDQAESASEAEAKLWHADARYDAILLDVGAEPVALHVVSGFMGEAEQGAKRRAFETARPRSWLWLPGEAMPVLPGPSTRLTAGAAACSSHAGPTTVRPNPAGRGPD